MDPNAPAAVRETPAAAAAADFSPEIRELYTNASEHLWVQSLSSDDLKSWNFPIIESGEGIYLTDVQGNRYIDCISGVWVVNAGHGREEIARAGYEQMKKVAYVNVFGFSHQPAIDLATKLTSITPGDLNHVYFANSGSEAVESALKIVRNYHFNRGNGKKVKLISRIGSYHGVTMGALSLNNAFYVSRAAFEPLMPGAIQVPGINCYHCPFEKTYPECNVFCARHIEDIIKAEGPDTVAGIIAEPISAANSGYVPPQEYWQILRDLCDKYDMLLVADEVINGYGRTGKWFAIEHFGVQPDLMTTAKGITSGYAPLAAVFVGDKVYDAFAGDASKNYHHGLTFAGNPMSAAVSLKNIEIMERENLVENARIQGDYLKSRFEAMMGHQPMIGEVRGLGLLLQVEIVKDRVTREGHAPDLDIGKILNPVLQRNGVLTRVWGSIQVAPPLCITREECDILVDAIDRSLTECAEALGF